MLFDLTTHNFEVSTMHADADGLAVAKQDQPVHLDHLWAGRGSAGAEPANDDHARRHPADCC